MNCTYLGAEEVSGLILPHTPISIFTLLTNITVPGTLCSVDRAKGYTSPITDDSVRMPFPLRWKLLSSAPLVRDMMSDKSVFPVHCKC